MSVLYICVSLAVLHIGCHHYHLSKFHIYALINCIDVFLTRPLLYLFELQTKQNLVTVYNTAILAFSHFFFCIVAQAEVDKGQCTLADVTVYYQH